MVSGSNEQSSQRHSKEDQNVNQITAVVVERRHQREMTSVRNRKTKKTEFIGGPQGEGRAPEVDSAVEEQNVM